MSPLFSPSSSGGIPKATISATTGSPTIDTASRPGKTIYKFTGSGTITVPTTGSCEILIVGGGAAGGGYTSNGGAQAGPWGAGSGGGGGAGGYVYKTSAVLPAGTLAITVGAGAPNTGSPQQVSGNGSAIDYIIAVGGGMGSVTAGANPNGGSGGGGSGSITGGGLTGGSALFGQGNAGGTAVNLSYGGGGGGAGTAGSGNTAGSGLANSITGTSITYAAGGKGGVYYGSSGGARGADGTANTGNGGGGGDGSWWYDAGINVQFGGGFLGGAGASGIVIVVTG
jgi:hypothetical protein